MKESLFNEGSWESLGCFKNGQFAVDGVRPADWSTTHQDREKLVGRTVLLTSFFCLLSSCPRLRCVVLARSRGSDVEGPRPLVLRSLVFFLFCFRWQSSKWKVDCLHAAPVLGAILDLYAPASATASASGVPVKRSWETKLNCCQSEIVSHHGTHKLRERNRRGHYVILFRRATPLLSKLPHPSVCESVLPQNPVFYNRQTRNFVPQDISGKVLLGAFV